MSLALLMFTMPAVGCSDDAEQSDETANETIGDGDGNWWYAMGDLQGTLAASGPGLADCLACHSALSVTDYLHGVSPADQAP